ncbi:hypothetical protein P7H00_12655 [Enterococcus pseudoavium]|uniref:Uncharacterized protein n=1 Tax=Enterococcus pseudoavium TaxID=44007 RepID=A0AAE4I2I0_9ENTE|nr:hypothetical protein [Enterococcus pseudoavium]MDT2737961.1 hypothetical protein [Enterococcus pseudoavium]
MNCYLWELEALLEGLALKQVDEQEQLALFGFNLRYILNAKKPNLKKVFNKSKQEQRIKNAFKRTKANSKVPSSKVVDALNHFKNRK